MSTKIRLAATSDLHVQQNTIGRYRQHFEEISNNADILLICGDLTDTGLIEEAQILLEELSFCKIPIVGILGNHDFANHKQEEIKKLLSPSIHFLEEHPFIYQNIGFAGVKGFGGGFDNHLVIPFGEETLRHFVDEAVKETSKLEEALARLETKEKVVLLHYSPISQTIVGETKEIYPLLGTSRLKEPIENFKVNVVFHGHAHHGRLQGKTTSGIPVYNVSLPLLQHLNPPRFYITLEI